MVFKYLIAILFVAFISAAAPEEESSKVRTLEEETVTATAK